MITHEELHHRWWSRGIDSEDQPHHPRGGSGLPSHFYETVRRYRAMSGWE
ncbi:hypothetical protein [Nocardiopsis sp. FIRDI 009]